MAGFEVTSPRLSRRLRSLSKFCLGDDTVSFAGYVLTRWSLSVLLVGLPIGVDKTCVLTNKVQPPSKLKIQDDLNAKSLVETYTWVPLQIDRTVFVGAFG